MEDNEIIELYWKRDEVAILETDKKYGKYCSKIAYNILASVEDSEENALMMHICMRGMHSRLIDLIFLRLS